MVAIAGIDLVNGLTVLRDGPSLTRCGCYCYRSRLLPAALDLSKARRQHESGCESPRLELRYYVRGSMDIEYIEGYIDQTEAYLTSRADELEIESLFSSCNLIVGVPRSF